MNPEPIPRNPGPRVEILAGKAGTFNHEPLNPDDTHLSEMNIASIKVFDSVHGGSLIHLSDHHVKQLVALFNKPSRPVNSVLGGRTSAAAGHINGIGDVVVKQYNRGGLVRHFVKRRYLRWGKTRSRVEFEVLQKVRQLGINAPRPIAYAHQGALFYRAWLATEEIKQPQTLAQLSLTDPDLAFLLTGRVVEQIATLIHHDIFHVDLHPGNVLVDHDENTYLIDFDKTRFTQIRKDRLRKKYRDRWKRAVIKHRLPGKLYQAMDTALVQ